MSIHYHLLFAVVILVWLSGLAALFQWTYRDARARNSDQPTRWALAVVVLLPLALPYYLLIRDRHAVLAGRSTPPTAFDRILATWAAASLWAFFAGWVLMPPDPLTQIPGLLTSLVLTIPAAYLLIYCRGFVLLREMVGR